MNHIAAEKCYLVFARKGKKQDDLLLVVANFAGVAQEITTGVPSAGKYKEIFNSDDIRYGGTGMVNSRMKRSNNTECDDRENSVKVKLAPLSLSILRYIPFTKEELAKEKEKTKLLKKTKKNKEK